MIVVRLSPRFKDRWTQGLWQEFLSGGTKLVRQTKVFTNFGPVFQPKIMCSPKKVPSFSVSSIWRAVTHQLGRDISGLTVYVTLGPVISGPPGPWYNVLSVTPS